MGIEPTHPAWKAGVLPLNYTRVSQIKFIINKTLFISTIEQLTTKVYHGFLWLSIKK